MKIAFFQIEDWEIEHIKEQLAGHELFFTKDKLSAEALPADRDFDIVSVFVGSKVDQAVLAALPNLKLVTTRSTGFDHIDLALAQSMNIATGYVPGYGENTVAEFAFGLILALSRKIYESVDRLKETGVYSYVGLRGFDLQGKTLGVVGTGRIGQHVIRIAKGFSMNVIAYDAFPKPELATELGFTYATFDELLGKSDVITLHVPYLPSTHHLINMENIAKIKKGALLVNTARGAVVDTAALVKALADGILGGAGLDVLEEEGVLADEKTLVLYGHPEEHNLKTVLENHVLIDLPNVLVTPHNAFNTQEALQRILDTDICNIQEFIGQGVAKCPIPVAKA
ncbi:MAG: D-isomer specific 2-hydroxyacid dehydrogenase NAD-binding protein [Candidatus Wolfebacteria bacterium GW2011_GWC2_39_22]|uniref:D-isomer specific 2-hydroxyacid dehydrogenase NAD-binding protein n=1 Tax=Candidatus Wolfebacteria bacterium GW2011_GWC2_39_22 TaxID=1619013 RepID=A0A0G0RFU7_9BACT|nr:MAG: D-isomer specific 2-hydroxyacid dehydrogenase NAD-binding protein [Candidatus Wolfebacteria bacterium GW2011_GWC2_39_22]HBI25745.1 hydroxyacid dehydrogenase [Candidatus Wolfebacteria bacterium]